MGRPFKQYLDGPRIYSCSTCRSHVADHDDIISKAFQGRHGRAYLFSNVVNVTWGPKEERLLITGVHTVADIYCTSCNTVLGWKYEHAVEEREKYKEGKSIVEKAKVMKVRVPCSNNLRNAVHKLQQPLPCMKQPDID